MKDEVAMRLSFRLRLVLPLFFSSFRLVYIPASVLTHTGHGLPWLTALLGLLCTFGVEHLARHRAGVPSVQEQRSSLAMVAISLLLLGLFPEEAPIGLILWAGIGAAWGMGTRHLSLWPRWSGFPAAAGILGGAIGLLGLIGPGSWLAAGLVGAGALVLTPGQTSSDARDDGRS